MTKKGYVSKEMVEEWREGEFRLKIWKQLTYIKNKAKGKEDGENGCNLFQ
jgi:hypothetical protein